MSYRHSAGIVRRLLSNVNRKGGVFGENSEIPTVVVGVATALYPDGGAIAGPPVGYAAIRFVAFFLAVLPLAGVGCLTAFFAVRLFACFGANTFSTSAR
jgi:hypothetical protein